MITIPISEIYIGDTSLLPTPEEVQEGRGIILDEHGVPVNPQWLHIGGTCGEGTWIEVYTQINGSLTVTVPISQIIYERLQRALVSENDYADAGRIIPLMGCTEPEIFSMIFISSSQQYVIYKCLTQEGTALSFRKLEDKLLEMTVRGLYDLIRPQGDQLCYILKK